MSDRVCRFCGSTFSVPKGRGGAMPGRGYYCSRWCGFWANVAPVNENGCWLWQGVRHKGYGMFHWGGIRVGAHQEAWTILRGEIPDGHGVLHNCPGVHEKACVRHLYTGTQADNARDMIEMGQIKRPGCDERCWAHRHDADAHEAYGRILERQERPERIVRTGSLLVNLDTKIVMVDNREILLPDRELSILLYLTERIGQWCSSQDIVRSAWGQDWAVVKFSVRGNGQRRSVSAHAVNQRRYWIRRRLGDAACLIESLNNPITPKTRLRLVAP